ncbi:hypothetical protein ACWEPA_22570 [Streptomyces filamentosus]
MSRAFRFDQRATALVELRGLRSEHELFEEALAARGWPVLDRQGRDTDPLVERRVRYVIEARFPGSRFNAAFGARERIELVADELRLDLQVQAVECVDRDPKDLPRWFVHEPPEVPAGASATARLRGGFLRWSAENLGTRDTGRLIMATTPQAAGWLATRPLPGTPARPAAVARRAMGAAPTPSRRIGSRRDSLRMMSRLLVFVLLGFLLGAHLADVLVSQDRWSWTSTAVLAGVAGCAAVAGWRIPQDGSPFGTAAFAAFLVLLGAGGGGYVGRQVPDQGFAAPVLVALLAGAVVANGIRLLVRQWSWQRVAPWLLPALIPLAFGLLPGVGTALHVLYLDAFDVDLEDVEVPRAFQFMAMLKLTACLGLWFLAPSVLGYMKHFHWHVKDRMFGNFVVFLLSVLLVGMGFLGLGLLGAEIAGEKAAATAAAGRTPRGYYGIEPEWVCLAPVGKLAEVPVDGGVLEPKRPYLKLGDSGGVVVLWDAGEKAALKVPLERLRLAPADSARVTCGSAGPKG